MKKVGINILVVLLFMLLSCNNNNLDVDLKEFNYIIGTQTVGAKYKFTEETNLVETAKAIHEMGSNILKFSLSPRYYWENYDIPFDDCI